MSKILLIDGLNMIHKSNIKFAFSDPNKQSFNIVYNFFRSLKATINKFNPSKVFFCLEGRNNQRYSIFPNYKANRLIKKASSEYENVSRQRDLIINLLAYLPITIAYAETFEADDVIGFLCENLKNEDVIIFSSDSDFIQLLQRDLNVRLYNPIKKEFIEPPKFHYLGWKILKGDKSDNIPGLVGEVKAKKLIENPKLLEDFLSVEENKSGFNLNKELIELRSVPANDLIFKDGSLDLDMLKSEFKNMEFKSMLTDKYWSSFKETFENLSQ